MAIDEKYMAAYREGHDDAISEMRRTVLAQANNPARGYTLDDLSPQDLERVLLFIGSFSKNKKGD
jgi:hypothetical protein